MTSSNSHSAGDSPDYIDSLLAYLGEREPLDVFSETPNRVRAATEKIPQAQLALPEAPGKWSVLQVVQHLGQTEVALGYRYRTVLAEDGPALPVVDQDAWIEGLYPEEVLLEEALENFSLIRTVNLRLLRRVRPEQWSRYGIHSQRGKETLASMVRLYAAHDCYHLFQIERIHAAVSG
tara:strand:+ start:128 stop:661 length:534 start_codon:yes stop_codon:yes gene_type:complete